MSKTPIAEHLIHKPEEVEENGRLFDAFVGLIELEFSDMRQLVAANFLEKIRQVVLKDGEFKLPLGLVVRRS